MLYGAKEFTLKTDGTDALETVADAYPPHDSENVNKILICRALLTK